ncbi:MAG: mechanosensitive ion channel family protein, partial [Gemmatimonadota bacterium]|nr:mechanosensitive ion channel family protein [Gemmatimonadota bacterium]
MKGRLEHHARLAAFAVAWFPYSAMAQESGAAWIRSTMPAQLRHTGFLLEHWQWLGLLAVALVGVIVDRTVRLVLANSGSRILLRLAPESDAASIRPFVRPVGLLAMALFWGAGLGGLDLPAATLAALLVAVKVLAAAAAVWTVYRFVDVGSAYFEGRAATTSTRYDDVLIPLIRKSLKIFIAAFGVVFVADNLNVNITSLLAGLGLGGLAFALAAQDTVKNLFGSLTVLLDRPFQVGDWIVIDDLEGTVEEVGFRSTRIRTFYDSLITMPNANLINSAVDNLGVRTHRRWSTKISLAYSTPPDRIESFCEGVRELIRTHPETRKDYFHVYLNTFSESSVDVLLYVFFNTPDWAKELDARHRLFLDILRLA